MKITQQCHIWGPLRINKRWNWSLTKHRQKPQQQQKGSLGKRITEVQELIATITYMCDIDPSVHSLHSTLKSAIFSNVISSPMWFIIIQDVAFVVLPLGQWDLPGGYFFHRVQAPREPYHEPSNNGIWGCIIYAVRPLRRTSSGRHFVRYVSASWILPTCTDVSLLSNWKSEFR